MSHVVELRCVACGKTYPSRGGAETCSACGMLGILDVVYDLDAAGAQLSRSALAENGERSHWRYLPLLPVERPALIPPLSVGWTPLYTYRRGSARIADELGVAALHVKDDGRNPTASLKDRASAIGVVKAREVNAAVIAGASTGNAASSLAGMAASVGLPTVIFVPRRAPKAKIAQLLVFGATVVKVDGTYDEAYDLCMAAVAHYGWYNRCAAVNPYLVEGKKTVSLEICEQLGFRAPDRVYVSVGDGCTIAGVYKGFAEMHALGLTDRVPRIIGVQAEGAQAIKRAFEQNAPIVEVVSGPAETIADSISVGVPRNPIKAVEAVRKSDGYYLAVRDAEILEAMKFMGKKLGIFGEPAGVTGFAGFQRDLRAGAIDAQEEVAVIVSGNGLKDVETAIRATGDPPLVPPTLEGLTRFLAEPQAS